VPRETETPGKMPGMVVTLGQRWAANKRACQARYISVHFPLMETPMPTTNSSLAGRCSDEKHAQDVRWTALMHKRRWNVADSYL
jgi:hypothetical protein